MPSRYTTAEVVEAVTKHPERLRKITRESVLSLPVPAGSSGQEQLAFFRYPAGGPANNQIVRAPTFQVTANLDRLDDIQFLPIARDDARLGAAPATPLGNLRVGGPVAPGELRPLQAELWKSLDAVLDLALAAAPVSDADKTAVASLDALYRRLSVIVLLPAYRALNPAFFFWLEQNTV